MTHITLRVLDGSDRGKVFEDVSVPVTIGREEGNSIQLNDDRISRFHLKIQQDHDDLVLTDLGSTNGSKVNNETVQLRILRHGDVIHVGRSALLFGNRREISQRLEQLQSSGRQEQEVNGLSSSGSNDLRDASDSWRDHDFQLSSLLEADPPALPDRLSPGQAAQLCEVMEFLHLHLRSAVSDAEVSKRGNVVSLNQPQWQRVLDTQAWLAEYMRRIGQP